MVGKRALLGLEMEAFLLDTNGHIVNKSDLLMRESLKKGAAPFIYEVSNSMIEVGSRPHGSVRGLTKNFFSNLIKIIETAEKFDIYLYPFGTYPGKSKPEIRKKAWYRAQAQALGNKFMETACRISGFHFHFNTPKGIVDKRSGEIFGRERRGREIYLNQFNFLVAADPAIATFMQSSPYYEGRLLGKDARILAYRDLEKERGSPIDGMYKGLSQLGGLPPYATSISDLKEMSESRKEMLLALLKKKGAKIPAEVRDRSPLTFQWGPLRTNKIGTLEQRGMDMNTPLNLIGVSSILKRILGEIFLGNLKVRVEEFAMKTPFKIEGDRIYIPPYSYVRNKLQYKSALDGFESPEIHAYCKALYNAATKLDSDDAYLLSTMKEMLALRKSKSDEIIDAAGGMKLIPPERQGELALKMSSNFHEETELAQRLLETDFETLQ
ncbi:MAG: hypothetical protein ABH863_04180 [Candidatus Micrarchaeota archaeon]